MEIVSLLSQQLKERESKQYSHRAEAYVQEMKDVTSKPAIDPLSRKIAELVTLQEMEMLGIKPKEVIKKKKIYTLPTTNGKQKRKPKHPSTNFTITEPPANLIIEEDDPREKFVSPDDVPVSPKQEKPEVNPINDEIVVQRSLKKKPTINSSDLIKMKDYIEVVEKKRKQTQEMITNLEHLEALRKELQEDYPELEFNNSQDGSSFHTNELNELEEACRDLTFEGEDKKNTPENQEIPMKVEASLPISPSTPIVNAEESHNSPVENLKEPEPIYIEAPIQIPETVSEIPIEQPHSPKEKKPSSLKVINIKTNSNQSSSRPTPTPSFNFSNLNTVKPKKAGNMESSYAKSSLFHSPSQVIGKSVPRCHYSIPTGQCSPIYLSIRADKDCKIKCKHGLGLADSLRRQLLEPLEESAVNTPMDFYSRNLDWLKRKNDKLGKTRLSLNDIEIKDCTFEPVLSNHENTKITQKAQKTPKSLSLLFESNGSSCKSKSSLGLTPRGSTVSYTALSPANAMVRYQEGYAVDQLTMRSKPMINYKSVNHLK